MLLQVKSFVRLVAIQELRSIAHVRVLIESEPDAKKWDLITDCLNTHQSESLVRLVAEIEGLEFDLGIKGESGILNR